MSDRIAELEKELERAKKERQREILEKQFALERENAELRAACAQMQEALEKTEHYFMQKCHNDCPFSMCEGRMCDIYPLQRIIKQTLNSTTAGRDMLERALHRLHHAAGEVLQHHGGSGTVQAGKAMERLREAWREVGELLERGRE